MDIKQLRYFVAVAEAKSFTAAAAKLHVSQPALGLQIRGLEEMAQVKLLDRHSRGVLLTDAGRVLLDHARLALRQFDQVEQALREVGGEPSGSVMMGVTPTIARHLVATVVSECGRVAPRVLLSVQEGLSRDLLRRVSENRLDVCITSNRQQVPGLRMTELIEEDLYFVGPVASEYAAEAEIELADALSVALILPSRPHGLRTMVDDAAVRLGIPLNIRLETNSTPMKRELVVAGVGHAIMPFGAIMREFEQGQLFARRIVNPGLARRLCLGVRKEGPRSLAVDTVHDIVLDLVTHPAAIRDQRWRLLYPKTGAERTGQAAQ